MFDLLPQIIIIISIAGIIVIIARKIPQIPASKEKKKVDINSAESKIKAPNSLNKVWLKIKGFRYSEHSHKILGFLEKILRKLKVFFLKLENKITNWAERLRIHSQKVKTRREGMDVKIESDGEENTQSLNLDSHIKTSGENTADKTEEEYIAAITKNPRDLEAYRNLGNVYVRKNDIKDAREAFRQILRISPSDKDAEMKLRSLRIKKIKKI